MKSSFTIALLILVSCSTALCQPDTDYLKAEGLDSYFLYMVTGETHRIEIQSENGLISVLDVPEGNYLEVRFKGKQNPSYLYESDARKLPLTLRGDIVIRTKRINDADSNTKYTMYEIMETSPMIVNLEKAEVVLHKITSDRKNEGTY